MCYDEATFVCLCSFSYQFIRSPVVDVDLIFMSHTFALRLCV